MAFFPGGTRERARPVFGLLLALDLTAFPAPFRRRVDRALQSLVPVHLVFRQPDFLLPAINAAKGKIDIVELRGVRVRWCLQFHVRGNSVDRHVAFAADAALRQEPGDPLAAKTLEDLDLLPERDAFHLSLDLPADGRWGMGGLRDEAGQGRVRQDNDEADNALGTWHVLWLKLHDELPDESGVLYPGNHEGFRGSF